MTLDANELDMLIERLAARLDAAGSASPPDAIDAALAAPSRTTNVERLANHPAIQAFRNELVDGMIRADTARQLLQFVTTLLDRLPMPVM